MAPSRGGIWPPTFTSRRMRKVHVALNLGEDRPGGESFHAEDLGNGLYRVANLLVDAPFSLGDVVRAVEHPWGTVQVVAVAQRSPATTVQVTYGVAAAVAEDVAVVDAVHRVHTAFIRSVESAGMAAQSQVPGWTTIAWPMVADTPRLAQALVEQHLLAHLRLVSLDPAISSALQLVAAWERDQHVEDYLVGLGGYISSHPSWPLGTVDDDIDDAPEEDPRLPPMDYVPHEDPEMVAAARRELDGIGRPPGIDLHRLLAETAAGLAVDQDSRDLLSAGQYDQLARRALSFILFRDNRPIPTEWYAA